LVAAAVLLAVLTVILFVSTAPRVYEAQSDMLVTPVPDDDPMLVGLPLIRSASDPTRDVETAARLVENVEVAAVVKRRLKLEASPEAILDDVSVDPVAQSNVITITASSEKAAGARALANEFARSAIAVRTQRLHAHLDTAIESLRTRIRASERAAVSPPAELTSRLATVETLRSGPDPTLQFETRATLPAAPSSPSVRLALAVAIFCGLLLGVAGVFLWSSLDDHVRNEADVQTFQELPVLATLPRQSRGFGLPGADGAVSPAGAEQAYRMLRLRLLPGDVRGRAKGRAVVITSPAGREGKSTTALNLAASLAAEGSRVIVMEVDLHRPRMW
jgi:capsular polysaccharide biosynthesis protein